VSRRGFATLALNFCDERISDDDRAWQPWGELLAVWRVFRVNRESAVEMISRLPSVRYRSLSAMCRLTALLACVLVCGVVMQ